MRISKTFKVQGRKTLNEKSDKNRYNVRAKKSSLPSLICVGAIKIGNDALSTRKGIRQKAGDLNYLSYGSSKH